MRGERVAAVIVTYYPDEGVLVQLVEALIKQCVVVIVVNNSDCRLRLGEYAPESCPLVLVENEENLGIGAAQNIGISIALKRQDITHVAVFDQDSQPDDSLIENLLSAEVSLRDVGAKVAAVGPQLVDESTGDVGVFIDFSGFRKKRLRPSKNSPPVECFSLLASGTLFRRETLDDVGLMNPDLFLEYVDVEWGARARAEGYICYGVPMATLYHNLGDSRIRLPWGVTVPFHRPVRHYYTMRNALFMQRQDYVPFYWKINDVLRTVAGFVIYSFFNPPRLKQVVMMTFGIFHGINGTSGPFKVGDSSNLKSIKRVLEWASS